MCIARHSRHSHAAKSRGPCSSTFSPCTVSLAERQDATPYHFIVSRATSSRLFSALPPSTHLAAASTTACAPLLLLQGLVMR